MLSLFSVKAPLSALKFSD